MFYSFNISVTAFFVIYFILFCCHIIILVKMAPNPKVHLSFFTVKLKFNKY